MPSFTKIFGFAAALASIAQGIMITSPKKDDQIDISKPFTIEWTYVSTDPTTVNIHLSHQAGEPTLDDSLFENVDIKKGSLTVSGLQFPSGSGYQINFLSSTTNQIYAQSNQFSLSGTTPLASSTLSGFTPSSTPTPTPTATATASATATPTSLGSTSSSGTSTQTYSTSAPSSTATPTMSGAAGSNHTGLPLTHPSTGTASGDASNSTATASGSASTTPTGTSTAKSTPTSKSGAASVAVPVAALLLGAVALFL